MQTLEFDHNIFQKQDGGDDSLFVVFYWGTIRDDAATEAEGRPIVKDTEYIRIIIPGDKNNINDRPASKQDKARFAKQYAAFRAGVSEEEQLIGTRLKEWPLLTRAQVEEYAYLGIKTVEQLGEARDDVLSRVPGMRDMKQAAQIWLGRSKATAEAAKALAKEKEAQAKIESLEIAVREQAERIEQLIKDRAK
jgi:hypothetical protein